MRFSAPIDYFLNRKDALDSDKRVKGRFFVASFLVFFLMCKLGEFYITATGFGGLKNLIANSGLTVITVGFLYIYKYFGYRTLLVNIIALCGASSYFNTNELTGGIYSPDFGGGVAICCWIFHRMSVAEQKVHLADEIGSWKKGVEQGDDMLLIGIRL
jgi:hypothetical protein